MKRVLSCLLGLTVGLPCLASPPPRLPTPLMETRANPDAWLAERVEADTRLGVWPQALPRIQRNVEGKAETAILYIHGWGATRAEGEHVVEQVADAWNANVLYMRLPGHGRDAEAHYRAQPDAYTRAVSEALSVTAALGDRVVVVGSSTGGLLATWAAGQYPEMVDALVLASPFYEYAAPYAAPILRNRAATALVRLLAGRERDASWEGTPPEKRRDLPGYEDHWLITQRTLAMRNLDGLRRGILASEGFPGNVEAPVLLLHYYKNEDEKDTVVSTEAMIDAFDRFHGGQPHPLSRRVPIADGNHILTSRYVRVDHAAVFEAMDRFLTDTIGPAPTPPPGR